MILSSPIASAAPPPGTLPAVEVDRYEIWAHGETHFSLFRRALLPGRNGALVVTETRAPAYQIERFQVTDLDLAGRRDSLDLELSAWGRLDLGEADAERGGGDLQTLSVRYHDGPIALRLGRQQVAGGAARYARFDGGLFESSLGANLTGRVYGGWEVLPRWNQPLSYQYLGAVADSQVRDPEALAELDRASKYLFGAGLDWTTPGAGAGLSFHEAREAEGVSRRSLGADARASLGTDFTLGGAGIVELSAGRVADARVFLDARPLEPVDLTLEALHAEPALFLSRTSVLSVFSSDSYQEVGGLTTIRLSPSWSLEGAGFVEIYSGERPGGRAEGAVRFALDEPRRTWVRFGYTRVTTPDNGYHAVRASIARQLIPALSATLESYLYRYDQPIREYRSSTVGAGTLSYRIAESLEILGGGSVARSPYASLDAQAELRASYDFDFSARRTR